MHTLKENFTGKEPIYKTLFSARIEENKLIFEFYSSHCSFNSYSNKDNDTIYKGDVVEVFLSREGKENHYYEIEVAPNGTKFFSDIYNDGKERICTMLDPSVIQSKVLKVGNDLATSIILDLNTLKDINVNAEFNAFRIDTDNEKTDKHLFTLNPTLCETFHVRKAFVKLSNYLEK